MLQLNFNPFPILTTERLVLRQVTQDDKQEIFFLRSDKTILKYLDKKPSPSLEETIQYIDRISTIQQNNEAVLWGIALKEDPKVIGTICYWRIEKEHDRAEIGYVLHTLFQRKGIMNGAMKAVLNFGFNQMKLHSVEARVNPGNKASIAILERNNFVREGYFKEDFYFDGRFLDTGVYSLLTPII